MAKHYSHVHARKLKERLLPDTEVFSQQELEALTVRRRKAMFALDAQMKREQRHFQKVGICPTCNVMLTTEGRCSVDATHSILPILKA